MPCQSFEKAEDCGDHLVVALPQTSLIGAEKDIHEPRVGIFVIGDDRKGHFDFLEEEGCEVVNL